MNKTIVTLISISLLTLAIAVFYYLVVFIPSNEGKKRAAELKKLEQQENEKLAENVGKIVDRDNLNECLDEVNQRFQKAIKNLEGQNLTLEAQKLVIDEFGKQKDECFKKFPTN